MAYDQHGPSNNKIGTVAGYNWVENNIKKFLGQEAVAKEKLILGIPLYTRTWWVDENEKVQSSTVNIKGLSDILPANASREWNDTLKQYYTEYEKNGKKYQMWIEDEKSIKEKIGLVHIYDLAGVAFWEKDREPETIWSMIKEELYK